MIDVRSRLGLIRLSRIGPLALAFVIGCGGGTAGLPTAKVTGKVTFDGQPVTGGKIIFAPDADAGNKVAGKNGFGQIGADGTYTISTYGTNDGAVLGKHKLSFMVPPSEAVSAGTDGGHAEAPQSPYADLVVKQVDATVSKGENKIDVELVKKQPSR